MIWFRLLLLRRNGIVIGYVLRLIEGVVRLVIVRVEV
jgi:hypothetical protein